jgi:hypothetical protein
MRTLVVAVCVLLLSPSAYADTDYACLNACVGSGGNYMTCMPKCTYNTKEHPQASNAAMDPTCLETCVAGGLASNVCVPQCTTATEMPAAPTQTPTATFNHDIFKAPVVSDDVVLTPPASATTSESLATIDYSCVKLCVQGGLEYQLCTQRCTPQPK